MRKGGLGGKRFLWFFSILLGFYFLYAPLLPLLLVHRGAYRKATDVLFNVWESFNVVSLEKVQYFECKVKKLRGELISISMKRRVQSL